MSPRADSPVATARDCFSFDSGGCSCGTKAWESRAFISGESRLRVILPPEAFWASRRVPSQAMERESILRRLRQSNFSQLPRDSAAIRSCSREIHSGDNSAGNSTSLTFTHPANRRSWAKRTMSIINVNFQMPVNDVLDYNRYFIKTYPCGSRNKMKYRLFPVHPILALLCFAAAQSAEPASPSIPADSAGTAAPTDSGSAVRGGSEAEAESAADSAPAPAVPPLLLDYAALERRAQDLHPILREKRLEIDKAEQKL